MRPRTLTATAAALRDGTVTSVGLTEAAMAAADRGDAVYGAYLTRLDETAFAAARRADTELATGLDRGPLHGIPIGVKDIIATAEAATTAQSLVHDRGWLAGTDATVAARLRAAGAVLTGKTTTMEFACGMPEQEHPFPIPRNPWRTGRWAGGSSSGAGIGVATGMFLAGIGSDTAGSIRVPAAFCGVTGLMPGYGRVPRTGCVPLGYSLDRIGPLARSVRDCAAVLEVLAGPDPADPDSAARPMTRPEFRGDLTGLRVGVVRDRHFPPGRDPALDGVFAEALAVLAGLGARLSSITLPYQTELVTAVLVTVASEALAHHRADLCHRWLDFGRGTRGLLATGALVTGADYVQAQRVRQVAQRAVGALFTEVDLVVCPTASVGAPPFASLLSPAGLPENDELFGVINTPYWNGLANPVLALPMGFTADGLPLSLQLAGPVHGEPELLEAGDAFQSATGWHLMTPPEPS